MFATASWKTTIAEHQTLSSASRTFTSVTNWSDSTILTSRSLFDFKTSKVFPKWSILMVFSYISVTFYRFFDRAEYLNERENFSPTSHLDRIGFTKCPRCPWNVDSLLPTWRFDVTLEAVMFCKWLKLSLIWKIVAPDVTVNCHVGSTVSIFSLI